MELKTLECSSAGDKRFSSLYAKVTINGVTDTIENHYQKSKRFYYAVDNPKGKKPDYMEVNGHKLGIHFLTPWYNYLWIVYLDAHPDLVEYAKGFDIFSDMFRGKSVNCQADVIKEYLLNRVNLKASVKLISAYVNGSVYRCPRCRNEGVASRNGCCHICGLKLDYSLSKNNEYTVNFAVMGNMTAYSIPTLEVKISKGYSTVIDNFYDLDGVIALCYRYGFREEILVKRRIECNGKFICQDEMKVFIRNDGTFHLCK